MRRLNPFGRFGRQSPGTVAITRLTAADLMPIAGEVLPVYHAAFAEPPYNRSAAQAQAFGGTLLQHLRRQDFRCCLARTSTAGRLIGFTYGYSGAAGQWWRDIVAAAMSANARDTWLAGSFEFVELAVLPEAQGRGIGGRLHDALLEGLSNPTAVLSTIQYETAALQMYRGRGWVTLLENLYFPNVPEPYLVMGIDLAARRARIAGGALR